jgi:hypothetical protein
MFDRVGSLAQRVATHVSRRAFLGRLGQGALGLTAVIAGVLALPSQARAGELYCVSFNKGSFPLSCNWYYQAVNGTCPCGGGLVDSRPKNCTHVKC